MQNGIVIKIDNRKTFKAYKKKGFFFKVLERNNKRHGRSARYGGNTRMILGVKIQNKETKEFYCKGGGWNKVDKVWSRLRDAKLAICPHSYYWCGIDSKELNSDFVIINDDGIIERMPVALYFFDYFTRGSKSSYGREKKENIIKQIKQYCKDNKIKLEEI